AGDLSGNGTLSNIGTIVQTGGDVLLRDSTAFATTLRNQSGGLYDIQGDWRLLGFNGGGTFDNRGILRKSAGSGTALVDAGAVTNTGTVIAQSGTFALVGVAQVANNTLTAGTWIVWNNATLTLNNGAAVSSLGGTVLLDGPNSAF